MVMEASPSPQSVGREFVRQYYTLLNKAPAHLHRFYNNSSSFVHGGLDAPNRETPPVIGQKQIHNRIQQLNFRDCHAKISQVDSQATLGSGVVVQVTGELSNGGAPMRRFTQTFVLAAQSPKKYYVHNDIFRYQDVVFSEEECEGARSEGEEDAAYPAPAPPAFPPAPPAPAAFPPAPPAPPAPAPRAFDLAASCLAHLNGHDDSGRQLVAALQATSLAGDEPDDAADEPAPEEVALDEPVAADEPALPPPPPEPKTYANLLKSGGSAHVAQATHAAHAARQAPPAEPAPARGPPPPRAGRAPPRADPAVSHPPADAAGAGGAPGGPRRYSDNQQLFLGNVPPSATEEELRALFGRYGAVAELRLFSKAGGRSPNYGFITYEQPQSALNCLSAADELLFPPDGADQCKLNVEEKKARARGPGGETRGGRGGARGPPSHRPAFPPRATSFRR